MWYVINSLDGTHYLQQEIFTHHNRWIMLLTRQFECVSCIYVFMHDACVIVCMCYCVATNVYHIWLCMYVCIIHFMCITQYHIWCMYVCIMHACVCVSLCYVYMCAICVHSSCDSGMQVVRPQIPANLSRTCEGEKQAKSSSRTRAINRRWGAR